MKRRGSVVRAAVARRPSVQASGDAASRTQGATVQVCGAIPPHILRHAAAHGDENARRTLETTLQFSSLITGGRRHGFFAAPRAAASGSVRKRRNVYDACGGRMLPGSLVMDEQHHAKLDLQVVEAFQGSGMTYDFFAEVFGRNSIDDHGLRLDSTVHFGERFDNALWNGKQMIYGDGDGKLFNRFTSSLDVIAHELTHGITQYSAKLGYAGESGALNEHISDVFGIMVKQYSRGLSSAESDWLIGVELLAPGVKGKAVRSMANPGSAYDDPMLGRDPQVGHMADYDRSTDDNGGVHVNSGIPNHAFYLAAVTLGGTAWDVLGQVWYQTLTRRLEPDTGFLAFARATVDEASTYGRHVAGVVREAWAEVGLLVGQQAFVPVRVEYETVNKPAWEQLRRPRRPRSRSRKHRFADVTSQRDAQAIREREHNRRVLLKWKRFENEENLVGGKSRKGGAK